MSRFTKLAADGQELAADATDHVAVRDNTTGLIWSAATLTEGEVDHHQAEKVAAECRLMDAEDWRLPTIEELFLLADRSRYAPAIDTDAFPDTRSDWYWSSSPYAAGPGFAWFVAFHDGDCYGCRRGYDSAFVRAVRGPVAASECHGATFSSLYRAWRAARRRKKPSINQATFERQWADHLVDLSHQITAGQWQPSPCASFIAQRPKAREIHAPDFGDRVVHHWLIPQLEHAFEPAFSDSSFSNRPGRGTHAAVDRLQRYVRQVHSGQGGGWFLQLDIANFFNRIHRPTLWRMLKRRMGRAGIDPSAQQVAHALLRRSPLAAGVRCMSTADQIARVPRHKRLANSPAGCGLPIGNLSSQFFANVYLDPLDQFVRHRLKARRYVRYVDDFVLVHSSRQQLEQWQVQIEQFLADDLRLSLKAERTAIRIDFTFKGVRCRETLPIEATATNLKYAENLRAEIQSRIARSQFVYTDYFPESPRARIFGHQVSRQTVREALEEWLADAGPRTGELFGLEWEQLSIDEVLIDRAIVHAKPALTKTSAGRRVIPLTPMAAEAIRRQKAITGLQGERVFYAMGKDFWPYDYWRHYSRPFKHACQLAGVRYRNPYQLRHTFASQMLSGGENPLRISTWLGHEDATMVLRVYGKWIEQGREFVSNWGQSAPLTPRADDGGKVTR